jgi:hypothetical protein
MHVDVTVFKRAISTSWFVNLYGYIWKINEMNEWKPDCHNTSNVRQFKTLPKINSVEQLYHCILPAGQLVILVFRSYTSYEKVSTINQFIHSLNPYRKQEFIGCGNSDLRPLSPRFFKSRTWISVYLLATVILTKTVKSTDFQVQQNIFTNSLLQISTC